MSILDAISHAGAREFIAVFSIVAFMGAMIGGLFSGLVEAKDFISATVPVVTAIVGFYFGVKKTESE